MKVFRKIVGFLIIFFIAIPILYSTIWISGVSLGILSKNFLIDMSTEIVKDIPEIADGVFEIIQKHGIIKDENTSIWIDAAVDVGKKPSNLLDELKLTSWAEEKFPEKINEIGNMIKGKKTSSDSIVLDLIPLKEAMESKSLDSYIYDLVASLPACSEEDILEIEDQIISGDNLDIYTDNFCMPPEEELHKELADIIIDAKPKVSDQIVLVQGKYFDNSTFNYIKLFYSWMFLLYIVSIILIFLGAVIADSSLRGFLRWSSIPIFTTSLFVLITALILKNITFIYDQFSFLVWDLISYSVDSFIPDLQNVFRSKSDQISTIIVDSLMNSVIFVATIFFVIGLLMFIVSFYIKSKNKKPINKS